MSKSIIIKEEKLTEIEGEFLAAKKATNGYANYREGIPWVGIERALLCEQRGSCDPGKEVTGGEERCLRDETIITMVTERQESL